MAVPIAVSLPSELPEIFSPRRKTRRHLNHAITSRGVHPEKDVNQDVCVYE
jgi:hypothetical protein